MSVKYFDNRTEVLLGDRVETRALFRKRIGRVVYVPGISEFNPEFEYNGIQWVGIRFSDRSLIASPVKQATGNLNKKVKFLARDNSPCELITASSREFEQYGEGPSF